MGERVWSSPNSVAEISLHSTSENAKMTKCKNVICTLIRATPDVSKTKRDCATKCCRTRKIQHLRERGWVANPSSVRTQMCQIGIWSQLATIIPHVAFSISNPCDRRVQMLISGSKCEIRHFMQKRVQPTDTTPRASPGREVVVPSDMGQHALGQWSENSLEALMS